MLEAVCLGTRCSVDALSCALVGDASEVASSREGDSDATALRVCGGATKSAMWLQMHADACDRAVLVGENSDAPLLGCAVLAQAAVASVADGPAVSERAVELSVANMVRSAYRIAPRAPHAKRFDELRRTVRARLAPTLAPLSRSALEFGATAQAAANATTATVTTPRRLRSGRAAVVAPSLLAADAGALRDAAKAALAAGADWLHLDVTDGSAVASGALSCIGPATVAALRRALPNAVLDVHLAVAAPGALALSLSPKLRVEHKWLSFGFF